MSSRFNEILHGDPATLEAHCADGDLDTSEICAALSNLCGQILRLERRVDMAITDAAERSQTPDMTREAYKLQRLSLLQDLEAEVRAFLSAEKNDHNDRHFRGYFEMYLSELETLRRQWREDRRAGVNRP